VCQADEERIWMAAKVGRELVILLWDEKEIALSECQMGDGTVGFLCPSLFYSPRCREPSSFAPSPPVALPRILADPSDF